MNISLTPELEQYIQKKVKSGLYTSVSEVIRESLRVMRSHEDLQHIQMKQLKQDIELGLQQLKSGNKVSATESYQRLKEKLNRQG